MSAAVRLSGKLAADEQLNGLDDLHAALVEDPETLRVALVWLDVQKITVETDSHAQVPTVRVRRIEPLGEASRVAPAIQEIVAKAVEARTGQAALPFDVVDPGDEE